MDWELPILALVGVAAGTVNTIAGGGSLITLPALIFAGMPADVANGTNRVGVALQSAVATWRFREASLLDAEMGLRLLAPTCLGALAGALISAELDAALFRRVIGVAMLVMLGVLLLQPKRWLVGRADRAPPSRWVVWLGYVAVGFYGGFLQAGVGVVLLAALVMLSGLDLVRGNGVKALLVTVFTVPAMAVFMWKGLIDWAPGLAVGAGSMAGGWLGTHLTVTRGANLVRWVMVAVVTVSATKLLGLW